MEINLEEIRRLIDNGNLSEVSRVTGIPRRTLQDWKLGNNKWLDDVVIRLTKLQNFIENNKGEEEMKTIEQLENYIANYNESGNAVDPVLGMNKNDAQSLKKAYENGDLFLYDSESYSEYVNDSIEEYASDEKFIASFKNKLDEFESSKSRFVLEDTDGNVYFVKWKILKPKNKNNPTFPVKIGFVGFNLIYFHF